MDFTMSKNDETFLERWLVRLEDKLDKNTALTEQVKAQAERTNGRVTDLEKRADKHEVDISKLSRKPINPKNLNTWYKDPAVLRILTYVSLALLLLVGGALGTDIGGLIP